MRVLSNGGKTSVVWTSTDAAVAKSSVFSAVVGDDGSLSGAVELSANRFGISASDVALDADGTYGIVANTFDAEGTHNLEYTMLGTVGDLKTAGASAYAADDGTTRLTYGVLHLQREGEEACRHREGRRRGRARIPPRCGI